ncbi:MAG: interleukin-like EMT inducer domain-containing protein [Anaerolineae bacterium]
MNRPTGRSVSSAGWRRYGPALAALLGYVLLSLVLTYPLVLHLGTHVPGSETWAFDEYTFVYNQWWFKYALLDLGTNPLYSDHIWVPVGINFVLYTYAIFNAALSLPLQPYFNLALISNLIMLFSTAMSGFGAFLLLRYLLAERRHAGALSPAACWWAAWVGGALYAFAGNRFVYLALGHYDMVSTEWLPLFALFFLKSLRERRPINPILAGLFAAFAMLCEMIFGVFLALLALVLWLCERPLREWLRAGMREWISLLGRLGLMLLSAGVPYAPMLVFILREMRKGYLLSGWGDALILSADLFSFITPTKLNPIFGGDWPAELSAVKQGVARFADVNTVVVGIAAILLALLAVLVFGRRVRAWLAGAITFAVLCLGPVLQVNGKYLFDLDGLPITVPLPFILLHYIPIAKGNRAPNRNSVILMLAVAVLAGYAVAWILERVEGRGRRKWATPAVSILLCAGLLVEHLSVPLPLTDARVPAYYYQLAQEPGDFTILALPLGWRDSFGVLGAEDTRTQYYQTVHHKRLLSGNSGRHEPFKTEYYASIPFFKALADIELYQPAEPAQVQQAREQAPALAYLYDLRYVVVHPAVPGRPPYADTWDEAEQFILQTMPLAPAPVYQGEGMRVYRVIQPPAEDGFHVDAGAVGWEIYRGEGWDRDEEIGGASAVWATGQPARLFLPLRDVKPRRLTLRLLPFDFPGAVPQTVEVRLNGHRLGPARELASGWQEYTWEVPAEFQRAGLNVITLAFSRFDAPRQVLPAQRAIGTTGVETPVDIEVNSAGEAAGDFAYITIEDGRPPVDGSTHRRGYNFAVLDPRTGRLVQKAAFDTAANAYEAQKMAEFLADVPAGYIVVGAVRGRGADYLTDEAVQALWSIGSGVDPRQEPARSHAIIGVKGAPAGSAAEVWQANQSWLRLGSNPDARTLAAALDWAELH